MTAVLVESRHALEQRFVRDTAGTEHPIVPLRRSGADYIVATASLAEGIELALPTTEKDTP